MSNLLEKLESIAVRFNEVGQQIVDPDIIANMDRYVKLTKEYKDLEQIVLTYHEFKNVLDNIASSKEMVDTEKDPEMREMAKMELDELLPKKAQMEDDIKMMLIPKDH
jgi:peptide chain release factor 1